MSTKPGNCSKLINPHFAGVLVFISFNYFVFVYAFTALSSSSSITISLVLFHLLFCMLIWSMASAIGSDPGRVPIYWGFFAD